MVVLNPAEVADLLVVNVRLLAAWRSRGVGPPYVKLGGRIRYAREDLDAWVVAQRVVPGEAKVNGADADVEQIQS